MQKGFLFDLNRCTGCGACTVGCWIENRERQQENWRDIHTFNVSHHPDLPMFHLSLACNHCGVPACMLNCPAKAISKDDGTGAVTVDPKRCLGCKYCTWACPYDAPKYTDAGGVVEKCDFCVQRLKEGEAPACVCACPTNALRCGGDDVSAEPPKPLVRGVEGFTDAGLEPGIGFKPLRDPGVPEITAPPDPEITEKLFESTLEIPPRKISLKNEWTLLVFTSIAFILVAFFTASLAQGLWLSPELFLGSGVLGMILSTVHLGKKARAFRAIFNLKTSWLSREIFLFSLFLGLAGLRFFFFPNEALLGWAGVVIGYLSLFAIDRLYQVAMHLGPLNFHSAQTLFNGLYLAGILTGNLWIFGGAGLIKLCLYVYRKKLLSDQHRPVRPWLSAARMALGFFIPAIILAVNWVFTAGHLMFFSTLSVLVGEIMDRTEFYDELDIITPPKQILTDLRKKLKT